MYDLAQCISMILVEITTSIGNFVVECHMEENFGGGKICCKTYLSEKSLAN